MFKAIRMVFEFIGGFFKFMTELLEWMNSELDEVNDHLEKSNEEVRRKRLEKTPQKRRRSLRVKGKRWVSERLEVLRTSLRSMLFLRLHRVFLLDFTPLLRTLLKRGWTYPKQRFGDGL